MALAFKVAANSGRHMGTYPTGNTSPAKMKPILLINGYWPWYTTTVHCLGKKTEHVKHFGRKALTSYMVSKRLEEEHVIKDHRKYWK